MKKVSLNIVDGSPGRILPVFGSVEAAYVWYTEANENPAILDMIDEVDKVVVNPGDYVEVEWRGCEFTGTGTSTVRVDLVRFARCYPSKNGSGHLVSLHYGWVLDCIIPFRDYKDEHINVRKLLDADSNKLNLGIMFKDDEQR